MQRLVAGIVLGLVLGIGGRAALTQSPPDAMPAPVVVTVATPYDGGPITVPASLPAGPVRVCAARVTPDLAMFLGVTAPPVSPALAIVGGPGITIPPMLGRQEGTAQMTLHAGPSGSGNTLAVQNFGGLGDPRVPCPTLSTGDEAVRSVTVSSSHSAWVFMISVSQ